MRTVNLRCFGALEARAQVRATCYVETLVFGSGKHAARARRKGSDLSEASINRLPPQNLVTTVMLR